MSCLRVRVKVELSRCRDVPQPLHVPTHHVEILHSEKLQVTSWTLKGYKLCEFRLCFSNILSFGKKFVRTNVKLELNYEN